MRRLLLEFVALVLLLPLAAAGDGASQASKQEAAETTVEKTADPPEDAGAREDASVADEEFEAESDAMRDPAIAKVIRARVLIDKAGFSLETGGKIQVQYYDADPDDSDNEDEWVLRRFRPFLMGRMATDWRWKLELEMSSQITALDFDKNELDIRDAFVRYVGFEREGRRLTLGNAKPPFSRDFMTPSTTHPFTERTFVGVTKAGVPDRAPGVHFRSPMRSDRWVLWASAGTASHKQDVRGIRFESTIGASSELNLGWLAAARVDFRPQGALFIGKETHYDLSLAGYKWANDGDRNPFTSEGESLDPEKADLDEAEGVELSGRLQSGSFFLTVQYNLIQAETLVSDFTGGIYVDGTSDLEASNAVAGIRMPGDWLQLVGGLSRLDSDGYAKTWDESILGVNLETAGRLGRMLGKLQITHRWISNRFGEPDEDYRETRFQIQYVW